MKNIIVKLIIAFSIWLSWCDNSFSYPPLPETEEERVKLLQGMRQPWETCKDRLADVHERLGRGKVLFSVPLQKYDPSIKQPNKNKVVLVGLDDNETIIKAIFKPRSKAKQQIEQGAFKLAEFIGMPNLIMPISPLPCDEVQGSVSYYIDVEDEKNPWKTKVGINQLHAMVSQDSLNDFYAFAKVFGMWDLKWVNVLFVGSQAPYNILSIDNEDLDGAVHETKGEHPFVCWKRDPECKSLPYGDLENFIPSILEESNIPSVVDDLMRFFIKDASIQKLKTEEERRETIQGRIKSFFWGKKTLPHYIGKKGWWLQLYDGFPDIPAPHVTSLSEHTLSRLKELTVEKLKECFEDVNPDTPLFCKGHYEAILMRCENLIRDLTVNSGGENP